MAQIGPKMDKNWAQNGPKLPKIDLSGPKKDQNEPNSKHSKWVKCILVAFFVLTSSQTILCPIFTQNVLFLPFVWQNYCIGSDLHISVEFFFCISPVWPLHKKIKIIQKKNLQTIVIVMQLKV